MYSSYTTIQLQKYNIVFKNDTEKPTIYNFKKKTGLFEFCSYIVFLRVILYKKYHVEANFGCHQVPLVRQYSTLFFCAQSIYIYLISRFLQKGYHKRVQFVSLDITIPWIRKYVHTGLNETLMCFASQSSSDLSISH